MIIKKETLVFLTSLAIIFIIGYVNMTLKPENELKLKESAKVGTTKVEVVDNKKNDGKVEVKDASKETPTDLSPYHLGKVGVKDASKETVAGAGVKKEATKEVAKEATKEVAKEATKEVAKEATKEATKDTNKVAEKSDVASGEILGDITDITDINTAKEASSSSIVKTLNESFASFKINKQKSNMDVLDHLEENLSNSVLSEATKKKFEELLYKKNNHIEAENKIELMLESKGYNETIVIVDDDTIKIVSNDKIEQKDATRILDVVVSETKYEPSQIKIVKFDNIDL